MQHAIARNTASQAALTAFALERIAAQLLATLPDLQAEQRAVVEESAVEIWQHADALLVAATEPDLERIRNAPAR